MGKVISINRKAVTAAGLALSMTLTTSALASEWTFQPSLTYSMYKIKPDNGNKLESSLYSLNLEFELEDGMGNFHRVWGSGTIHDKEKSKLETDLSKNEATYRIGKYFYPQAEPTDFSIWAGLGYREIKIADSMKNKTKDKVIHIPFGFEYATPLDNRSSWPTGFSVQRNHSHFLVMGAELNLLVHGEGNDERWKENDGLGYSVWFGYDYRFKDNRILTTSFSYEALKIEKIDKSSALSLTIGLRFL